MVNREVVLETIIKMHNNGIEDSVIKATLEDIGLKDDEIAQYMAEVSSPLPQKNAAEDEQHEKIAQRTADKIKFQIGEEREERELKETTHQNILDDHHQHLENVEQKMGELHQKVEAVSTPANKDLGNQIAVLEQRINGLDTKLSDLKAISAATKDLMEKVLEVNRKILNKL